MGKAALRFAPDRRPTFWEAFMKLKLVAAIWAVAIPALANAQQSGPQSVARPTKADAQKVVQIITSDRVKAQAYCDLTNLEGQVKAAEQKNDTKTLDALSKQADALVDKLGPEYYKLMDGLEEVDPKSTEAQEFMSIISELDKRCTK
jgi:hypothetical protein